MTKGMAGMAGKAGRALLTLALWLLAMPLAAQSKQLVSVQVSGELVFPTEDYGVLDKGTTLGWEAQARFTFGRFSVGAGYQRSEVFKSDAAIGDITATLSLGFVEPRYVLGVFGNVAAPYVAARIGYGSLLVRSPSDLPGGLTRRHRRGCTVFHCGFHRESGQCGLLPDAAGALCRTLLGVTSRCGPSCDRPSLLTWVCLC